MAVKCLKEPGTGKYLLMMIEVLLRNELISMCFQQYQLYCANSLSGLKEYSWKKLLAELDANAPVFLSILRECTRTRRFRPNQDAVLGMCAAILLKHRFSKMSLVQKILSLVPYGGHSGKQV